MGVELIVELSDRAENVGGRRWGYLRLTVHHAGYRLDADTGEGCNLTHCRGGRLDVSALLSVSGWLRGRDQAPRTRPGPGWASVGSDQPEKPVPCLQSLGWEGIPVVSALCTCGRTLAELARV